MFGPSAINLYKISVISEETGDAVVPTKEIDGGTFSTELSAGSYTVIVQGTHTGTSFYELGRPIVIGRKNSVTVKAGETTEATVTMGDFSFRTYPENINSTYLFPLTYDWGSGKLPQDLVMEGYVFDGWYTDSTFTKKTTEYPDTSDYVNDMTFKYPVAHFTAQTPFPPAGTQGVYYASADGSGEGTSPEGPANISTAFTALTMNGGGTLYLMGDEIELPSFTIDQDVTIIGAGGTNGFGKVTVKGAQGNSQVIEFSRSATYTVKNVIVDGENSKQGISNAGNLSLINCEIINCSGNDGAGICNSGTLNLENTKITGCTATAGNSIYCSKADGATPTVNGVGNEYPDYFYYNNDILPNEYTSTTFPYLPIANGVFYATQNGAGDNSGRNVDNAIPIITALVQSSSNPVYFYASSGKKPTLYVSGDIELSTNHTQQKGVKIIGVLGSGSGEAGRPKVTSKGTISSNTGIFNFSQETIYTLENFHIDGTGNWIGIYLANLTTEITIKNCYFYDCGNSGVYISARKAVIEDCIFYQCNSSTRTPVYMDSNGIQAELTRCKFIDCSGGFSGGIYYKVSTNPTTTGTSLKIKDCIFTNCKGTSNPKGNALLLAGPTTIEGLTITGCSETEPSIYVWSMILSQAGDVSLYPAINGVDVTKDMWINGDVSPDSDLSKDSSLWHTN